MLLNSFKSKSGFSLVEVIVATAVFAVVAMSVYQGFISITSLVSASRDKVVAIDLINSEFELIRNLSFADVGLVSGIPKGVLVATSTVIKDSRKFDITRVIRNIDDPFDGTIGGSPNDLSPADYKMVQITVSCGSCKNPINLSAVSNVSPKNLETASTNGALFIKVFNGNGEPVPQANVQVWNTSLGININDTTNNNGFLTIVDAPPSSNPYRITVSKSGFTTDRTYATSTDNPNPTKPDAIVLLQQVTKISFVIDKVSDIDIHTITDKCLPVQNVSFSINGTKLIGTNPDVYKWTGNFTTDSSGFKNIGNLEWDTYSFNILGGFYLAGTNPISPISILPGSNQNVDLTVTSENPSFLLVNIINASTGFPISGATATLSGGSFNQSLVTDRGSIKQTDWSGGPGQSNFTDSSRYYSSDGNIEANNPIGELKLLSSLGHFVSYGELTSSIFDTGTSSNWSKIDILPADQPSRAGANSVKLQIATAPQNTETTTWNFKGPDGTAGSFYNILNNNINPAHNGDRYVRYKIFLNTVDTNFTPNVSDLIISFFSSCIPPGQTIFSNLSWQDYSLTVEAPGFISQTIPININSNWQKQDVLLQ